MKKASVVPISSELWKIEEGECFADILHRSQRMEHRNERAKACELRFEGAQQLLDIIGDMALVGKPIKGHITAYRPGHRVNNQFARLLRERIK